ncbi:DDE-type integrase/transposase/recombinase [Lactobacillus helveticus]|uniref:DDE-type integrase/transposase/recombinase n=1 Tax=Lactobacillus helveticus TaxID=1587 RepID=UPI0034A08FBA
MVKPIDVILCDFLEFSNRFCCKVLQKIYFSVKLRRKTEHQTVKYLNNLIEQDHRPIKRRNKFYQSLRTASSTIKGMETLRGIYKKNRRNGTLFGFSASTEIKVLMGIPA